MITHLPTRLLTRGQQGALKVLRHRLLPGAVIASVIINDDRLEVAVYAGQGETWPRDAQWSGHAVLLVPDEPSPARS